jgi:hypothetical protein
MGMGILSCDNNNVEKSIIEETSIEESQEEEIVIENEEIAIEDVENAIEENEETEVTLVIEDQIINDDTPINISRNIILQDSNNTEIGKVLLVSAFGITIMTPLNYIVSLNWQGEITTQMLYYSGLDLSGTVYMYSTGGTYGKVVCRDVTTGILYRPKNLDINGNAAFNMADYISVSNPGFELGYFNYDNYINLNLVELELTTLAEIGYMDNISLPLNLIFEE